MHETEKEGGGGARAHGQVKVSRVRSKGQVKVSSRRRIPSTATAPPQDAQPPRHPKSASRQPQIPVPDPRPQDPRLPRAHPTLARPAPGPGRAPVKVPRHTGHCSSLRDRNTKSGCLTAPACGPRQGMVDRGTRSEKVARGVVCAQCVCVCERERGGGGGREGESEREALGTVAAHRHRTPEMSVSAHDPVRIPLRL